MNNIFKKVKEGQMSLILIQLLDTNSTVTTLELKNELRKQYPEFSWLQKDVSAFMNQLHLQGELVFEDTGDYRIYSGIAPKKKPSRKKTVKGKKVAKVKASRISKSKAMDLILANKGYFFTAEFEKKDGDVRVMNCQCLKDQDPKLGYIKVREASRMRSNPDDCIRQINIQTLKSLKIAGKSYKIK